MKHAIMITALVVCALIGLLTLVGTPDRWPSPENPPRQGEALDAECLADSKVIHSEHALSQLIREPQNAWSNIAFVFGGAWLFVKAGSKTAKTLGIALIAVGVGSFLYHASASRYLRHLDVGAMYWVFYIVIAFSTASFARPIREKLESFIWIVGSVLAVVAVCTTLGRNLVIMGVKPLAISTVTVATAVIITVALAKTVLRHCTPRAVFNTVVTLTLFVFAVICQVGDRPGGWLCNPNAVVQPHALWHVFSATAFVSAVQILDLPTKAATRLE